jgi:hypothetical protein
MTSKRRKGPSNKVKQEKNKIKKIKKSKGKKNENNFNISHLLNSYL